MSDRSHYVHLCILLLTMFTQAREGEGRSRGSPGDARGVTAEGGHRASGSSASREACQQGVTHVFTKVSPQGCFLRRRRDLATLRLHRTNRVEREERDRVAGIDAGSELRQDGKDKIHPPSQGGHDRQKRRMGSVTDRSRRQAGWKPPRYRLLPLRRTARELFKLGTRYLAHVSDPD